MEEATRQQRVDDLFRTQVARLCRSILLADTIKSEALATWKQLLSDHGVVRPHPIDRAQTDRERVEAFFRYSAVVKDPALKPVITESQDRVWLAIDGILIAAANISRLLWGQAGGKTAERAALRNDLGIHTSSYFRMPTVRNHFEHMDERIESWFKRSAGLDSVTTAIGWVIPDLDRKAYFRNYDTATDVVSFWGDTIEIRRLVDEAHPLLALAEAPHTWPLLT